jgi:hypothetical protein
MIAASPRAWAAMETATMPRFYLDLRAHRDSHAGGETPWTPAIAVVSMVDEGIRLMTAEGAGAVFARHEACAAATRAAIQVIGDEDWRRRQVLDHVTRFRGEAARMGIRLLPSPTPIQPILLGSESAALAASDALLAAGLWVPAIRPPTVPAGSSRLRITFSAAHARDDVDRLLEALALLVREGRLA